MFAGDTGIIDISGWLNTVFEYFQFVFARRTMDRHAVFPEFKLFLAIALSLTVSIVFLYKFADPFFMNWFQSGAKETSGIFPFITDVGKSDWVLVSTGSVLLFMSIYRFPKLSASHIVHWHHIFLKFYFVFTTIAFSGLLAILIKNVIGRARPVFFEDFGLWAASPMTDPYMFASFPSGHSTTMGALIAALFLIAPRLFVIFAPIALLVAVSRIMVGAHFPTDVLAGLALGVVFTWVYARSFARKRLLFEFGPEGQLKLRDIFAKRARRKIRKNSQSITDLGFGLSRRVLKRKA